MFKLQSIILTILILQILSSCKESSILSSSGDKNTNSKTTTTTTTTSNISISLKSSSVVEINQCVPLILSLVNSSQEVEAAPSNLSLQITGGISPLYSDNTCSTIQASSFVLAKDAYSKTVYVKPTSSQSYVFFAEELSSLVKPQNFILSVTNPNSVAETFKFSLSGPSSIVAGVCRPYVVSLQNTLGVNKNATADTSVTLSGAGTGGNYYSGTNCSGAPISSLTILNGTSFTSFSYKNSSAENVNLVADSAPASGIQSTYYSVLVNPVSTSLPTQIVVTGPNSITAGVCSGPVVVRTVDALFNSTAVIANLNLGVTAGAGFSIYSDASCITTLVTPQITSGNSSTSFYFKIASAGNYILAADDSGSLTDGSISVAVAASSGANATKITMTGPSSITALACSSAYVVKSTDGSGIETPVSSLTTINLTGKGSGDFYSDSSCTTTISSLAFASGDSSKSFYFKGTTVSNLIFNADDSGALVPASQSVSIVASSPSKFIVNGPTPITMGDCRLYTVTTKDANDFVSVVSSTTSVNLTGASSGAFYSDSSCTNSTTSLLINAGQSSGFFYYKNSTAESVTLSADNSGVLTAGTSAVVVNPLPYSKVVLSRPSFVAGNCVLLTATLKDSLNNAATAGSAVSINLSETGSGGFYTASNCMSGGTSTVTVSSGQSAVTFYYLDTTTESISISATSSGITSDSFSSNVTANSNSALSLTGPNTNSVGSCVAYDLKILDAYGNSSGASSSTTINFSGMSNARAYSDSSCATQINSTVIASGSSLSQVYIKGTIAESITVNATASGLTTGTKNISLIAGSSNKLVMTGTASISVGTCTTYNVEVQDSFGNAITLGANLTVTLSGNGSGSYYSDSGCTAATSTMTINSGSSNNVVYFKTNIPASLTLTSQGSSLFDGTKAITINPLTPSKIVVSGASTMTAGICTPYTISLQDTLNNLSSVGSSKVVNLTGAGAGAYYSDSSCTVSISSLTFSSTQTNAQVYYKGNSAQTTNLIFDDSGLPDLASAVQPITVNSSGGATSIVLKLSGSSSINNNTCVPYAVMTADSTGISYNVTSNLTVTMGGAGTGVFYTDSACSTTGTNVTIATGNSLAYIYFKSVTAQNLVFSATSASASSTTLPVTVVASVAASASKVTLAGNTTILTNACIPYVVSLADTNGNSINATSNTTISFSGYGAGGFYTDDVCTTSAGGSTVVSSGSSYTTLYYKNGTVQNLILVAQSTGLSNATLPISISSASSGAISGPAVKLSFIAQPSTIASVSEVFGIQPIVAVQDSNNNVASSASNTVTLQAYTDSACTLSAGSILNATSNPLNANGGLANFAGLNATSAQNIYIKASSPGLASACSNAIQVYPSVAAKLSFSQQPSSTAIAGTSLTTQPSVSVLNYTNQLVTSATNIINLSPYLDSNCTTPATGTFSLTTNNLIPSSGVSSFAGVTYTLPHTIYIKASSSGLTSACSTGITVDPAAPYSIGIYTQPATSGAVGANFALTMRLYDVYGSLSPATHNITLTAYKSSNCTGTTSSITGNTATTTYGTATFNSIVFSETGTMSLKVSDSTNGSVVTACSNAITVDGGSPSALAFHTQPSTAAKVYTTFTTQPVVKVTDSFGNTIQNSTNAITLAAYTDAACTSAATGTLFGTSLTMSPTYGLASFTNMSYSAAQTIYLKATATGLTSACSTAIALTGMPKKIATRDLTSCAIVNGGVWCWGHSETTYKKLAHAFPNPLANSDISYSNYPIQIGAPGYVGGYLQNITDVTIGMSHICALNTSGNVYCWGRGDYGEIGDGGTSHRSAPTQVVGVGGVGYLSNIVGVQAGYLHTCALNSSGNVYCWGYNGHGQMGDNTTTTRSTPVQVLGVGGTGNLSNIKQISNGDYHDCALDNSGYVYCWGYGGYGQMGDNASSSRYTPVQVKGVGGTGNLSNITNITSSGDGSYGFNCAVNTSGNVFCWGYGGNGNMGDNGASSRTVPVQVLGVGGTGNLANITQVAAGGYHACAISTTGNTYCWGYNAQGQLGDNTTTSKYYPIQVQGVGGTGYLTNIVEVEAGGHNTCAIDSTGQMYCWGRNDYAQLGDGTTTYRSVPVRVNDLYKGAFTSFDIGYANFCGVVRERVYCQGYNGNGELGDGTTTNRVSPALVISSGTALTNVKQVSSSTNHSCALLKTGEVFCWGYNNYGQLGDLTTTSRTQAVQVKGVGGSGYLQDIIQITTNSNASCALNKNGNVFCWGYNGNYELGDGTGTQRNYPVQVLGENAVGTLSNITQISGGWYHNCALNTLGQAYCWGYNGYYQLGDGTASSKSYPIQVSVIGSGVQQISAGLVGTCALKNGAGYCWGSNSYSNTSNVSTLSPTPTVLWPSGVTQVAAGTEVHCAVISKRVQCYSAANYYAVSMVSTQATGNDVAKLVLNRSTWSHPVYCTQNTNGLIQCWGYSNWQPILNNGINNGTYFPHIIQHPTLPGNIHTAVATGETHSCANLNGIASCWGTSANGGLGSGMSYSLSPKSVLVNSTGGVLGGQLFYGLGSSHTCSLSYDGEVNCWGDNTNGRLGNNSTVSTQKAVKVVNVGGTGILSSINSLGVGQKHNCATRLGSVFCWGYNGNGQLGIDSTLSMASPVQVKGVGGSGFLTGVTQVVAGKSHSCAIKSGYVYCWGSNQYGQLGANVATAQINTPVQVVSVSGMGVLDSVTSLSAGENHTCAVSGGIAYCWGANTSKQLGNDSFTDSSFPVGVMNSGYVTLTGVSLVALGAKHSCAVTSMNEVYCWGAGNSGQIGNNISIDNGVASQVVGVGAVGYLSSGIIGSGAASNHTCSISADQSTISCWGEGTSGQLGNNGTTAQSTPVNVVIPTATSNFVIK